jgi:hypothetical protein
MPYMRVGQNYAEAGVVITYCLEVSFAQRPLHVASLN